MKHDRITALCLALLLGLSPAAASTETVSDETAAPAAEAAEAAAEEASPALLDQGLDLLDHSVHYPQLAGLADETLTAHVNEQLLETGSIQPLLNRLPMVMSSPIPLKASYEACISGGILSCVYSIQGPVKDSRGTHLWAAVNIDLETGDALTPADLFIDPDAAAEALCDYLDDELAPDLSAHLMNNSLTPLPEAFSLSEAGLTYYYPIDQLSTLSDRAGAVFLPWSVVCSLCEVKLDEGSAAERVGAAQAVTLNDDSPELIGSWVERGCLPGIPVALGGAMREATGIHRMLMDPDLCEAGRMFALEDAAFRGSWLITDALTRSWDNSVIQGIRSDNISFYGLCTGVTTMEDWRTVLGEPASTVTLNGERAEAWRLPAGISDYYVFGENRLRLHADENGVLVSLFLTP